jgi:hypothetical protein
MKHIRKNDYSAASLQPALRPTRQEVRVDPILAKVEFPINGLDRMSVQIAESYGQPILKLVRQRPDKERREWSPIHSFGIAFNHAPAIHEAIGRLIAAARDE